MPPPAAAPPAPSCRPASGRLQPQLTLQTLGRGDGLLGLKPCGPVIAPARTPLFGARGSPVTIARVHWRYEAESLPPVVLAATPEVAADRLQVRDAAGSLRSVLRDRDGEARALQQLAASGLKPLPADALQWRGERSPLPDEPLWSLLREDDFPDFCDQQLPRLQRAGWALVVLPGFAHDAWPVDGWHLVLHPDTGEPGARALHAALPDPAPRLERLAGAPGLAAWLLSLGITVGGERLDLVPLLVPLLKRDPRWTSAEGLDQIGDDQTIRLRAPGGGRIDAPAAPLKALVRTLWDWLTAPRRRDGPLAVAGWEAPRLEALRIALQGALAHHPSARRDWALQGEAGLALLAQRLAALGPLAPAEAPPGLGLALRPYQLAGLAWLQALRAQSLAGILADDMGLGKTAQALAHLVIEQQAGRLDRPALVVAPASLLANWQAEAARIAPSLRVRVHSGPRRAADFARLAAHDLVVTSYPLLWRDASALQRQPWHLVILDEAQMVKNAGSRSATAARRLNARHRLCLTGTPVENHLGELWSQFHFLLPGFLGDARSFARQWRTPIEKNGEALRAELLAQRVRPFILRRRKDQVASELPPLTEQVQRLRIEGRQRLLYESVRLGAERQLRELIERLAWPRAQIGVLDALLKLRQACCDPRLLRDGGDGGEGGDATPLPAGDAVKLDWLRAMLPTLVAEGRRVLVFSQFSRWLGLLGSELDALGLRWLALTGDTPTAARGALIARFQAGEVPLLLASLKAGGVGLNLTAADCVIQLEPWWNPAVEAQAAARAHRIGQDKPVWLWRLVAEGSIEERMLALQQRKAQLAAQVVGTDDAARLKFDAEELRALLAPLDGPRP